MIEIPAVFRDFCSALHQDILEDHPHSNDVFRDVIAEMPIAQRRELLGFVQGVLKGDASEAELGRIWRVTLQDWIVPDGDARAAFEAVRRAVETVNEG